MTTGLTPSVALTHGHVLTLDDVLTLLRMSRTTAKRRMQSGRFPIPALPRHGQEPYRFAATQVDRFLRREMDAPRLRRSA